MLYQIFHSIFTIHGLINNYYISLAFFMLKDKSEQIYTGTLHVLNTLCLKIDSHFKPKIIYIDFEKAIHSSITYTWSNISIRECRYHLGQA